MPRLTTAEAVVETLLAHRIETLFALPGVHNDPLFDAAHTGIRPDPRHSSAP